MTRSLVAWLVAAGMVFPALAHAKTTAMVSYPIDQVYPAAVRFLRIDEKLAIVEKDADAGYILFELKEEGKTFRGSFEIAAVTDPEGRRASRLIVGLEDRPAYMEQGLIDRLARKLRAELGDPKPAPAPKPEPEPAPPEQPPNGALGPKPRA